MATIQWKNIRTMIIVIASIVVLLFLGSCFAGFMMMNYGG